MNTTNFIQFKKERDLGAIITDTFKFLRLQAKPFFRAIVKTSLLPILLAIISVIIFSTSFSTFYTDLLNLDAINGRTDTMKGFNVIIFVFSLLAFAIFYLLAYVKITTAAIYYIKSYIDNSGIVDYEYVKTMVKSKFWSLAGLFVLNFIIIAVGIFFCFLPGIYLGVVLSLSTPILVFQEKSAMDSINGAFSFIKGNWWETFGILIVVSILVGVISYITQLPATIYQLIKMGIFIGKEDPTSIMTIYKDPIYLVLLVFSYAIRFLLYTVTLISTIFIYFDINEQKHASGSIDMIDSLGR